MNIPILHKKMTELTPEDFELDGVRFTAAGTEKAKENFKNQSEEFIAVWSGMEYVAMRAMLISVTRDRNGRFSVYISINSFDKSGTINLIAESKVVDVDPSDKFGKHFIFCMLSIEEQIKPPPQD